MASRGRRRPRDSEYEEEDVRVLNELNNSATSRSQHIVLSDDEDDSFTPRAPLPPQEMPVVWQPVVDVLHARGVKPRPEWLLSCLNQLAASQAGFAQMSAPKKAELCFEQFLMADFNLVGAGSLPPSMHSLHGTELAGPFVLQVDEIIDISNSSKDRYQEKAAGPGRTLKLSMTDGVQRVFGMEYRPIRALQVLSPAGFKVSLRNVCIRRGLLILVPEIVEILGGVVDHLEAARLRAVETINKPPRGRRVPRGVREPSVAERATRAAWPDETGAVFTNPGTGSRTSSGIFSPGTTNSLGVGDVPQRREQQQLIPQNQVADLRRPSAQVTPTPNSATVETERTAPEERTLQPNQGPASRVPVSGSMTYQTTRRMDVDQQVQQHYKLHQGPSSLLSTQSGRGSNTSQSAEVEGVQDEQQRHSQQHGRDSSWQPRNVSVIHQSSTVETVQQVERQQQPCHTERGAQSSRQSSKVLQSVTHVVEGLTPVPSQSPGAPLLSPSFGKLSLRSRRSTQAAVLQHTDLQSSQPSNSSPGDQPERPVEIIESQESEQGTAAEARTTVTETENIPFTYLTTLEDLRKANLRQDVEARGRVKGQPVKNLHLGFDVKTIVFYHREELENREPCECVIAGVGKFQYKGCDEFKLLLHIEDGTLITECSVAHQVVQDLIGHAPVDVSLKLANAETHQEMLEKMIRFQKFLERFEGYMDLEFRNSSLVPIVVNIVEGIKSTDAKALLRRLELSVSTQVPTTPAIS